MRGAKRVIGGAQRVTVSALPVRPPAQLTKVFAGGGRSRVTFCAAPLGTTEGSGGGLVVPAVFKTVAA